MKSKTPKTTWRKDWRELLEILRRLCWKEILLGFLVIVLCVIMGLRLGLAHKGRP